MSNNESFEQYSIKELRDLKSRKLLSDILQQQIDANQQLKAENTLIRQNQRKLLLVLQNKDKLLSAHPLHESQFNISQSHTVQQSYIRELELVKLFNLQLQNKLSTTEENFNNTSLQLQNIKQQKYRLSDRIQQLSQIIQQKENELLKIKNKKSQIHDNIQKQNQQYVQEILRINERFMQTKESFQTLAQSSEREKKELKREIINLKEKMMILNQNSKNIKEQKQESSSSKEKELRQTIKIREMEVQDLISKISDCRDQMSLLRQKLKEKQLDIQQKQILIHNQNMQCMEISHLKELLSQRSFQTSNLNSELLQTRYRLQSITEQQSQLQSLKQMVESIKRELTDKITSNKQLQEDNKFKDAVILQLQGAIKQLQASMQEKIGVETGSEQLKIQMRNKQLQIQQLRLTKEGLLTTIAKKDQNLVRLRQANVQIQNQYKREKDQEDKYVEKILHENRTLKQQILSMEKKLQSYMRSIQEKYRKIQIQNENLTRKWNTLNTQKQSLHSRFQTQESEVQELQKQLNKRDKQILILNRQITESSEESQLKSQVSKIKKQLLDAKAKVGSLTDINYKVKQQNSQLTKQVMRLNEENITCKQQLEILQNDHQAMQDKLQQLNHMLEQKMSSHNKGQVHLRQTMQQKRYLQLEIAKYNNELKTYKQLLETAKKSKAEEIISLNRTVAELRDENNKAQADLVDVNGIIQSCNKDKLNLMRQSTLNKQALGKLSKQNSSLKKEIEKLHIQVNESRKITEQYEKQLEMTYMIMQQAQQKVTRYQSVEKQICNSQELNNSQLSISRKIHNYKKEFNIDF